MTTTLTKSQIEARYPGEWVLIVNPELDEDLEVVSGTVLCHSKDRDEVYRAATAQQGGEYAFMFTGEMPPNTAIVI